VYREQEEESCSQEGQEDQNQPEDGCPPLLLGQAALQPQPTHRSGLRLPSQVPRLLLSQVRKLGKQGVPQAVMLLRVHLLLLQDNSGLRQEGDPNQLVELVAQNYHTG